MSSNGILNKEFKAMTEVVAVEVVVKVVDVDRPVPKDQTNAADVIHQAFSNSATARCMHLLLYCTSIYL
jgi:hypothetical protein